MFELRFSQSHTWNDGSSRYRDTWRRFCSPSAPVLNERTALSSKRRDFVPHLAADKECFFRQAHAVNVGGPIAGGSRPLRHAKKSIDA
jgi:hypothetical protein